MLRFIQFLPILMIALLYGLVYAAINRVNPEAFGFEDSIVDPFYFSFTTMSSVGYGDYSPKTPVRESCRHESAVCTPRGNQ